MHAYMHTYIKRNVIEGKDIAAYHSMHNAALEGHVIAQHRKHYTALYIGMYAYTCVCLFVRTCMYILLLRC
jgi:hypothetical protein